MEMYRFRANGVNLDLDPVDLPPDVWTAASNMVPRPKGMIRAQGYSEVFATPLFAPYFVMYTPQLGEPYWLYAGLDNVAVISPFGVHTDVTPAGMQTVTNDEWTGGNLNGIAVINAFTNPAYYWFNGIGATALELPGLRPNARYKVMRPFKYHLIGLGVTDDAGTFFDQVHWSDAADPGQVPSTWVPAPDNEAGDNILADEDGNIIDGLSLRDQFYIYKQDSIYEMTYAGGDEVFRFRKAFSSVGILANNCAVRVKGFHVVLGNGDIYMHDGQNMESIVDGVLRDAFFSTLDDESYTNSFAVYLEAQEEVWFCVPTSGHTAPNLALVWNVTTRKFGYRAIPSADHATAGIIPTDTGGVPPETWDSDGGAWDEDNTRWLNQSFSITEDAILLADATNVKLYRGDTGSTADGAPYSSRVERTTLDLGDPTLVKAVRRIWPVINAPQGTPFTLKLFDQRAPESGESVLATVSFNHGSRYGVPVNVNARYLGVEFATDESVQWDITGFDVEYLKRGRF